MTSRISRRRFLGMAGITSAAAMALPRRLSWAAGPAPKQALRLVFFADAHARTEWQTPLALEKATAAINAQRPELVIGGGDLITEGFESAAERLAPRWKVYLEMHRALEAEVHPVLGNHDLVAAIPADGSEPAADPRAPFQSHFELERTYRSFDAGGYHIILLDSIVVCGGDLLYEGRVEERQLEWLREDLARLDATAPIILVTHIPLLTGFYQATEGATATAPANRVVTNNLEVLELFADHNLVVVLQAHLHVDEMLRWRRTTFITGGALSGKWWRGSWHGTPPGFGVLTLRADRVDWSYKTYGWVARRP